MANPNRQHIGVRLPVDLVKWADSQGATRTEVVEAALAYLKTRGLRVLSGSHPALVVQADPAAARKAGAA